MFADCNSFASKAKIHLFLQSFSSLYWHPGKKKRQINTQKMRRKTQTFYCGCITDTDNAASYIFLFLSSHTAMLFITLNLKIINEVSD